jgi:hypothetical protein
MPPKRCSETSCAACAMNERAEPLHALISGGTDPANVWNV